MFNQYHPVVAATIAFLKLINVKVNNHVVDETLQSHPDWPSLLCISDSLNKWEVPNGAGRIDKTEAGQLPTPFLAYINNREHPIAIVTYTDEKSIHYRSKNYGGKSLIESRESFFEKWDGVYLLAEPTATSGEKDFSKNRRKQLKTGLIPYLLILSLVIFASYFFIQSAGQPDFSLVISGTYFQYILFLAGACITSLLLWYEIDKNNPALQKVCSGFGKTNCNAILTSKQSKIFSWLSWSEAGFFYFAGGLLNLIFAGNSLAQTTVFLAWTSLLVLPYTVFSIYYQGFVIKQWCVLCLAVQALLVSGAINAFASGLLAQEMNASPINGFQFILVGIIPVLAWYSTKPYFLKLQYAKTNRRDFLRLKFNAEIFYTLLAKQKKIDIPPDAFGIDLGNPQSSNLLVKVCNPYCGPCSKAHPKVEALLQENKNLRVKIIFFSGYVEQDMARQPVRHLLAIAEKGDETLTKKALNDWYLQEQKSYESFAAKYPMNGELKEQNEKVERMSEWLRKMNIYVTPTYFINGYQLPGAYSVEDLPYFLADELGSESFYS